MINRYSSKKITEIWTDQYRYDLWLKIEIAALEQMVAKDLAPKESLDAVKSKASFKVERIQELEAKIHHDVIAFLTAINESVGEDSRYLHRGLTSSDIIDTAFSMQLKDAGNLIVEKLNTCLSALEKRATELKDFHCMGRTHGVFAEPTTFGIKLLGFYSEVKRARDNFIQAIDEISYGKLAGAVGTYNNFSPDMEQAVLKNLGLKSETVPTQIVARDRHYNYFYSLSRIGNSIERFSLEIRHLQRSEVNEVEEYFVKGQKGSSAMPHKKNPWRSENLCGLNRLLRSYAFSASENVALWHERDISHSSVERVIGPDATEVAYFMLERFLKIIESLKVNKKEVTRNLDSSLSLYASGGLLIALTDQGLTREDAYSLVQDVALNCWDNKEDFKQAVLNDKKFSDILSSDILNKVFDINEHNKYTDLIFDRAINGEVE